jgi:membrane fusion protein (multidrug efflux system)
MTQPTTSPQRTDRIVARITTTLAGLLVLALLIWGGRIGWTMLHYETTDDAQVEQGKRLHPPDSLR